MGLWVWGNERGNERGRREEGERGERSRGFRVEGSGLRVTHPKQKRFCMTLLLLGLHLSLEAWADP